MRDESCLTPVGNVAANTHHMWRGSHWMPCFLQDACVRACVCVSELACNEIPHV